MDGISELWRAPLAVFAVADAAREESREAVRRLHDQNVEVIIMTGDAKAVAADLGIDTVFAEVLPDQKAAKVQEVQRQERLEPASSRTRCAGGPASPAGKKRDDA